MVSNILEEADLEKVRQDEVITMLFGYKRRLLEAARDDERARKEIFDCRAKIADVFRRFGGERHKGSVQQFESLQQPDDLLKFAPPKKEPKEDPKRHEKLYHQPGFYIFGEKLTDEQVKSIRSQNRTGLKVGNPIPISLIELFRVHDDKRPIYIHQQITDKLQKQIAVLIRLRPELAGRLHFLRFEDEKAVIEPYTSSALVTDTNNPLSEMENEAIEMLGNFIYHQPKPGEIFVGHISKVSEYGVFVEFLPGIEGLVHRGELLQATDDDCRTLLKGGEEITVQVVSIDGYGKIRLSARSATQSMEDGKQPLFADAQRQLLLTDNPVANESGEDIS